MKPRFWISQYYDSELTCFPTINNSTDNRITLNDIAEYEGLFISGTIRKSNEGLIFSQSSRVISQYKFNKDFTFFFLAKVTSPTTNPIFSSSSNDNISYFGYVNNKMNVLKINNERLVDLNKTSLINSKPHVHQISLWFEFAVKRLRCTLDSFVIRILLLNAMSVNVSQ